MSVVYLDSFDARETSVADLRVEYGVGRRGGGALHRYSYSGGTAFHEAAPIGSLGSSTAHCIMSFAFKPGLSGNFAQAGLHIAGYHPTLGPERMVLATGSNGDLTLWYLRSAYTVGTPDYTISSAFSDPDTYYFVEYKVWFGATGGWEVKVNGTVVGTQTAVDTHIYAPDQYAQTLLSYLWYGFSATPTTLLDMYVDDSFGISSDGALYTNYLGDKAVYLLPPVANGSEQGLSDVWPVGAPAYQRVQEQPTDLDTTYAYNAASSVGLTSTFVMQDIVGSPDTDPVPGVRFRHTSRFSFNASNGGQVGSKMVEAGGSLALANIAVSGTDWFHYTTGAYEYNPRLGSSTPWTVGMVNALEYGPLFSNALGASTFRCSSVYLEIIGPNTLVIPSFIPFVCIVGA